MSFTGNKIGSDCAGRRLFSPMRNPLQTAFDRIILVGYHFGRFTRPASFSPPHSSLTLLQLLNIEPAAKLLQRI